MIETYLSDYEILQRFPMKEEFRSNGKPTYMIDPRLIDYLRRKGFDLNKPIHSRCVDEPISGIIYSQEEYIIVPV